MKDGAYKLLKQLNVTQELVIFVVKKIFRSFSTGPGFGNGMKLISVSSTYPWIYASSGDLGMI